MIHLLRSRRHRPALAALLAGGLAVAMLADGALLDALQKMAGYGNKKTLFSQAREYLENLRDALIPLAIPLGAIGLTAGGVAYMVGNAMAQKILGGVVTGIAVALLAPTIIA
jgi:hypothetical protein